MQVKRLTAVILAAALLVGVAGTVCAAGGPGDAKGDTFRQAWEQVRTRLEAIRRNRESATDFQGQAVQIAARIRAEIKRIRDGGLPLRKEQLVRIRATIAGLNGCGRSLRATLGEIRQACIQAREARRNAEAGPLQSAYSRAEAVQEARLEHLRDLVSLLEEILAELESIK